MSSGSPDWLRTISLGGVDHYLASLNFTAVTQHVDVGKVLNRYTGVAVSVRSSVSGLALSVANASNNILVQYQTTPQGPSGLTLAQPLFFNVPFAQGDDLWVYYRGVYNTGFFDIDVFGLPWVPSSVPRLRPDGRLAVVGSFFASAGAGGGGPTTLVAAQGAQNCILVKRLYLSAGTSTANPGLLQADWSVNGISGNALLCYSSTSAPGFASADFGENGLLLDANTAITLATLVNGPSNNAIVYYDVVA